jgi:hypothetical protein
MPGEHWTMHIAVAREANSNNTATTPPSAAKCPPKVPAHHTLSSSAMTCLMSNCFTSTASCGSANDVRLVSAAADMTCLGMPRPLC